MENICNNNKKLSVVRNAAPLFGNGLTKRKPCEYGMIIIISSYKPSAKDAVFVPWATTYYIYPSEHKRKNVQTLYIRYDSDQTGASRHKHYANPFPAFYQQFIEKLRVLPFKKFSQRLHRLMVSQELLRLRVLFVR